MGLFSTKTKQTSSGSTTFDKQGTSSGTTQSINPEWVREPVQNVAGQVGYLGGADPRSFVAGPSALQTQAFDKISGMVGAGNPYRNDAMGAISAANNATPAYVTPAEIAATTTYGGRRASEYVDSYLNPYLDEVVGNVQRDAERSRQMSVNNTAARAQAAGAFGGARHGVADALGEGEFTRGLSSTLGDLRFRGYETALNAAQGDALRLQQAEADNAAATNQRAALDAQFRQQGQLANQDSNNRIRDRYLQSAGLLGELGQQSSNETLQQLEMLAGLGGVQRGIEGDYARALLDLLGTQVGLLGQLPFDLFRGQQVDATENVKGSGTEQGTSTGKNSGSVLGGLGGILGGLGSLAGGIGQLRGGG